MPRGPVLCKDTIMNLYTYTHSPERPAATFEAAAAAAAAEAPAAEASHKSGEVRAVRPFIHFVIEYVM